VNSNANDSLLLSKLSERNNNMEEAMLETRTTTEIIIKLDPSLKTWKIAIFMHMNIVK
jgi:hypothetical protein